MSIKDFCQAILALVAIYLVVSFAACDFDASNWAPAGRDVCAYIGCVCAIVVFIVNKK